MEQKVYHCLRYGGLAALSCSDEFPCRGVLMNGRKAEKMCCGLTGSSNVKSVLYPPAPGLNLTAVVAPHRCPGVLSYISSQLISRLVFQ